MIPALNYTLPTVESTFAFLKSPTGGSLMIRDNDDRFALVYYKKGANFDVPHVSLFRSALWDKEKNSAVFIGPARIRPLAEIGDNAILNVEEFIDGFMINMFWDKGAWRLTTRTQLDASGHFYGTRSFAELFWETFENAGLTKDDLDKDVGYSWVVQHPEERIVVAPAYGIPTVTLVSATGPMSDKLSALRPATYPLTTVAAVREFVASEGRRRAHQFKGLVVVTDAGRFKIRSAEYDAAFALRGSKRAYSWLEHWGTGKLTAYLKIYPEEVCEAEAVIARFKDCTQEAYDLYVKVYRERAFPLKEAPQKYRKLLWDARQDGTCAYFPNMRKFMNAQDTARKLWLVNYETRYGGANTESSLSAIADNELRYAQPELTGSASEAETRYGGANTESSLSAIADNELRYAQPELTGSADIA